ncbi:MAG: GldG family protein, partial [Chthoniobacteraceae bacterium]
METNKTTQPGNGSAHSAPGKGIRVGRFEVGFNIIVQIGLVIVGLAMLNWLGNKYYARLDWSRGKNITLSPQTKALLGGLEKPVQVIVMFATGGEAEGEAQLLLREYQFAAKGRLTVEEVDPYANLARAKELQAQYKFGGNENVVIFTYDGRHKFVNSGDLAEFEQMDQMAMMTRRQPQMIGFKGEQVFTSTLLELTETKQNKLYLLGAHGEYDGNSRETAGLREFLTRQNLKFETLKLADKDTVPEDASMVVILGPKFDFSERDLKMLSEYWEKKGRIFICTGWTNGKTPNLNEWLAARGVRPQNDAVIRVVSLGNMAGMQPLEGIILNQGSPITKGLEGVGS